MLHVDGSRHGWLGPGRGQQDLIVIFDDANSEAYYAQLVPEESTLTVMAGLKAVVQQQGVFCSLYVDRGSHFVTTPVAGGSVDREQKTQIGRALEQLGIELIAAYSPQARGRCERLFGTWQGRLVAELRSRQITTLEAANRFLASRWLEYPQPQVHRRGAAIGYGFCPLPGRGPGQDLLDSAGAHRGQR